MPYDRWTPGRSNDGTMWELHLIIEPTQYEDLAYEVNNWIIVFQDLHDALAEVDESLRPANYSSCMDTLGVFVQQMDTHVIRYCRAARSVTDAARGGTNSYPTPEDIDTMDRRAWYLFMDVREASRRTGYLDSLCRHLRRMLGKEVPCVRFDEASDSYVRGVVSGRPAAHEVAEAVRTAENYAGAFLARLAGTSRIQPRTD